MMKWSVTLLFLIFVNCAFAQNTYFEWVNPKTALRERIEVSSKNHLKEVKPGKWKLVDNLAIDATIFKNLPQNFNNYFFNINNGKDIWFTVEGTGMVYQFSLATKTFLRLDHTYYRGYNFLALKFVRENKLYSLGGNGFWSHSRNLTYFDDNLKEWEILRTQNLGPESINIGYNGYSAKADVIFAGASFKTSYLVDMKEVIDDQLFAFDFKKLRWKTLGHINHDLPFKNKWDICWDGEHFIQYAIGRLYLIDPIANTVQLLEDKTRSFSPISNYDRFFKKGDTIYNYRDNGILFFKFSKKELLKKAKYIGPFYTAETSYAVVFIIGLLALIGLSILYWMIKRKKKTIRSFEGVFDKLELDLINSLIALPENGYLTSNDMNDILGINDKSQDNQRKIKMNIINEINKKIGDKFKMEEAISRKNIVDDKRLKAYFMKPEAVALFKK